MRYTPNFTEDAALKRASSSPNDQKQRFNWSDGVASAPGTPLAPGVGALTIATGSGLGF